MLFSSAGVDVGSDIPPVSMNATDGRRQLAAAIQGWQRDGLPLPGWLGMNERLVSATVGETAPADDASTDWSPVIRACDRFYCVSAGEADDRLPCSPLWYTRLSCPPDEFVWHGDIASGELILEAPSKSLRWTASISGTRFQIPPEWRAAMTTGVRWRWSVTLPETRLPQVRGVFEMTPEAVAVENAAREGLSDHFAAIGTAIEAEFFEAAYRAWQQLPRTSFTAVEEFVAQRLLAYLFRQMAKRLQGPPLWMGEPEGTAAVQLSRHHLAAAWNALSMPVRW